MSKRRADQLVVEQGLAETRSKAQALIMSGAILDLNGNRIEKAGAMLASQTKLRIKGDPLPFVSRGGLKLQGALREFGIEVDGKIALDVGASTGGFTDCLLQRGVRKVYAVDVGYGQLAWSLRDDPRVVVMERQNIRKMPDDALDDAVGMVVIDVSFISLRLVVPEALRFVAPGCSFICLVKPQFEVGRELVGKGGIVRSEKARSDCLEQMVEFFTGLGFSAIQTMESPIVGAKGNHEFLLYALSPSH